MAWIVVVPPSVRHPHERHQVCYQEGKRHRSAGIFPTRRRALAEKRAIQRGRDELVGTGQCRVPVRQRPGPATMWYTTTP
jgi:hypothetical protein